MTQKNNTTTLLPPRTIIILTQSTLQSNVFLEEPYFTWSPGHSIWLRFFLIWSEGTLLLLFWFLIVCQQHWGWFALFSFFLYILFVSHYILHSSITEQSLKLLQVLQVLLITESRVVDNSFVVELHQGVHYDFWWVWGQQSLLLNDDCVQILNVDSLGCGFGAHLWLENLSLLFIPLVHNNALGFKIFDDKVRAVSWVLHNHLEFKLMICVWVF